MQNHLPNRKILGIFVFFWFMEHLQVTKTEKNNLIFTDAVCRPYALQLRHKSDSKLYLKQQTLPTICFPLKLKKRRNPEFQQQLFFSNFCKQKPSTQKSFCCHHCFTLANFTYLNTKKTFNSWFPLKPTKANPPRNFQQDPLNGPLNLGIW